MTEADLTRRTALTVGVGAVAFTATACSTYSTSAPPAASPKGAAGGTLGKTTEIEVGGGKVFPDQQVVVTQPEAGKFKAFSAVCTHQGCVVNEVSRGTINCPCHGSKFKVADGSVAVGPASRPLPARDVTVQGESVVLS
jgi:Rieske Fe-S protein